ncbi:hypothetical protein Dimus_013340 [Dionaea muscipula]
MDPMESILHTDVGWSAKFKTSRKLLEDILTPRDQRLLSFFSAEKIKENVMLMTGQLVAIWGEGVRRKEEQKKEREQEMEKMMAENSIMEREVEDFKKRVKQMEGEMTK